MKRINPLTGKEFKQGDTREDGRRFWCYVSTIKKANGCFAEQWYEPNSFDRLRVKNIMRLAKARCSKNGVPFSVTIDYLMSIFPADRKCPVLDIEFEWGRESSNSSPSLDRIIPSLGYVEGNVAWISKKANSLKSDGTLDQFERLALYLKSHTHYKFQEAA